MSINNLFVDETGLISGDDGYYILVGCVIKDSKRNSLERLAGQIKYKYWDDDSIVFHSQEIGKYIGAFKILEDRKVRDDFYVDLFKLLEYAPVILFPIILDKESISKKRWGMKRKLKAVSRNLIRNFLLLTIATRGCRGKIIIETSSLNKDYYYHEALNHFKANGIKKVGVPGREISDRITSLSFVNKSNGDIEEQIADIFAYGVRCRLGSRKYSKNSYESKLTKILENKIYKLPPQVKGNKKKLLSEIDPMVMIK
jgi:hypothetical protein